MKTCAGFWIGAGTGLMAGAAAGLMVSRKKSPGRRQLEKSLHKLGSAVDHAVDELVSELR